MLRMTDRIQKRAQCNLYDPTRKRASQFCLEVGLAIREGSSALVAAIAIAVRWIIAVRSVPVRGNVTVRIARFVGIVAVESIVVVALLGFNEQLKSEKHSKDNHYPARKHHDLSILQLGPFLNIKQKERS